MSSLTLRFEERVSPSSHIFDPYFHTYERVRASPVLFNAVMYATCRFMRPELSEQCLDLTETVIARMLRLGAATIPLIQAVLALVYWKKPKDRTAFVKLGTAVRLIQQMRITWPTEPQAYASEEDERAAVDVERTIYSELTAHMAKANVRRLRHGVVLLGHVPTTAYERLARARRPDLAGVGEAASPPRRRR